MLMMILCSGNVSGVPDVPILGASFGSFERESPEFNVVHDMHVSTEQSLMPHHVLHQMTLMSTGTCTLSLLPPI
jgi:hypothetical protein